MIIVHQSPDRSPNAQRTNAATGGARRGYEDMPLSIVLVRYLWPFWLFRDASSGDRLARAAAYRHNRAMRIYLPGYLLKWLLGASLVLGLTAAMEALASTSGSAPTLLLVLAALCGTLFAGSVCLLFVTAYLYLYLSRNE